MLIARDYVITMKYNRDEISPMDADFRQRSIAISNEFHRVFEDMQLGIYDENSLLDTTWNDIIFMIFMLNTNWVYTNNKFSCKKLGYETSLQYWCYKYLLENRKDYESILKDTYKYIPDPSDVLEANVELMGYSNIDATLSSVDILSSARKKVESLTQEETKSASSITSMSSLETVAVKNTVSIPKSKNKKILWVSRHVLQHSQLEQLQAIVGNSITLYNYAHRVGDIVKLADIAKKLDVDYVFAVMPDAYLITLKVLLNSANIPVYKQSDMKVNESIGVYTVNENGEVGQFSDLYEFNGWSEVKDAQLVTSVG